MYQTIDRLVIPKGITSVIGSGGKTTLLRYLSRILEGTVILTTSTHIYPFPDVPLLLTGRQQSRDTMLREIQKRLRAERVICIGTPTDPSEKEIPSEPEQAYSGKLTSPSFPIEALLPLADYILVEADGSACHPLKAHRPWEPVIPSCSRLTICVAGLSGIGHPIAKACHCPELFCRLAAPASGQDTVEISHIANVLNREALADCYFLNQTDVLPDPPEALKLCALLHRPAFAGSLKTESFL